MPVRFIRLRIVGFKSFADPVTVEILPGLTGIVGPNGCGKSNVVEALRWMMGENSARSLRGGEMDDLIFAGTAARPARNMAEVILTLEDAGGLVPPPFDGQTELQVSRRIERRGGSAYRINDHELRARDVQTLFTDLASGARSSALVSQGRVAALVGARPEERRSILEEAAGITALHVRRHEAELKLRATEANLARAEDVQGQLDARVHALGEQARQAERYREVATQLHVCETTLLALLHARAQQTVTASGVARLAAQNVLGEAERCLLQAEMAQHAAEADLPVQRDAGAQARTALERRRTEAEGAAREGKRAAQDLERSELRLRQATVHRDEAASRLTDAQEATARLDAEAAVLSEAALILPARRAEHEARLGSLRVDLQEAEQVARSALEAAVTVRTRTAEVARDRQATAERLERAVTRLLQIDAELAQRHAALPAPDLLLSHEVACADAGAALEQAARELDAASEAHAIAAHALETAMIEDADNGRQRHAAMLALQQATERAKRLAADNDLLQTQLKTAEAALISDTDRAAAREAAASANDALGQAIEVFEAARTLHGVAVSAQLEAWARVQDAGRERRQLDATRAVAEAAHRDATAQHESLLGSHARLLAEAIPTDTLAATCRVRAQAEVDLAAAEVRLMEADAAHGDASDAAGHAAMQLASRRAAHGRLHAEADGLAHALDHQDGDPKMGWQSLADQLAVPQDLEAAFVACLGDELEAACTAEAPRAWLELPVIEAAALPHGAIPLDSFVTVPAPLRRALSGAGLIEDSQDGGLLQAELQPGQCLVTRSGALWRWDGYRVAAGVPRQTALRLRQRRRLHDTRRRLTEMAATIVPAEADVARCKALYDQADALARKARADRTLHEQVLGAAREEESRLGQRNAETRAGLEGLKLQLGHAAAVRTEAKAALDRISHAYAAAAHAAELASAHETAKQAEVEAAAAAADALAARRIAELRSQQTQSIAAAVFAQHAQGEMVCASLAPLVARLQDEADAARVDLIAAQDALASLPLADAETVLQACLTQADGAAHMEQAARDAYRAAQARLSTGIAARDRVTAELAAERGRLDALNIRREAVQAEHDEVSQAIAALVQVAAQLTDPLEAAATATFASDAVTILREAERTASEACAILAAEQAAQVARRSPLARDLADWRGRQSAAEVLLAEKEVELAAAQAEQAQRAAGPAEAAQRMTSLVSKIEAAQTFHRAACDALDHAEATLLQAQRIRRAAGTELASAQEAAFRAGAREEQATAILIQLLTDAPDPPMIELDDLSEAAEISLRRRVSRLTRERDEIGPVNLRAEIELDEIATQITLILQQREEIEGAVARLRGQIGQLNREGRERLMTAFDAVDRQFQLLFTRMFGGGRAHLGMVGSDDPLSAGLEIYVQLPGKKLATLSLLSGGEQALTALSLIFAVFRCNPAPICVLDEVDAPLDDANVERFCMLLQDMVREAGTRFLVVTHHQLTMAHMDRLYGVTMQERGVSRMLSVDLARATAIAG